jgi:hypothetical protein
VTAVLLTIPLTVIPVTILVYLVFNLL